MARHTIAQTILVGARLKKIRKTACLTQDEVVAMSGHSTSHLSRMENGHRDISLVDAVSILTACKASSKDRKKVLEMLESAHDPSLLYEGAVDTLMCLEQAATSIFQLSTMVVPGLLQTPEYTHALMTTGLMSPDRIDAVVERKQTRQSNILNRRIRPKHTVILDESAVRTYGDPGMMADQLDHILKLAEQEVVTTRIIPSERGHAGFLGSYMHLEFNDINPIVYVESHTVSLFLDQDRAVRPYLELSASLDQTALSSLESVNFLRDKVAKLRNN